MPVDGLVAGSLGLTPDVGHGRGTPDIATTALTASQYTLVPGTSVKLNNPLYVGQRFRFVLGLLKTGAGTATFNIQVAAGTLNTPSDTQAILWTSGTNTALADRALCILEVVVLTIGAGTTATLAGTAFYVNQATDATGLGSISVAPTSTAGFNSTTATFLHVDVEPGTSAVMTGWGSAEKLN